MKPKLRLHWNVTSLSLRRASGLFAWGDHVTFSVRRGPLEAMDLAGSAAVRGEGLGIPSPHLGCHRVDIFCELSVLPVSVSWFDSGFLFKRQSTWPCTLCLRALVSSSHCSVLCSAEVYKKLGFVGDEGLLPLGSTADTQLASLFLSLHSWYISDEAVAALFVDNGIVAGFAGYDAPRAVFPSTAAAAWQCLHFTLYSLLLSGRPRFSAA